MGTGLPRDWVIGKGTESERDPPRMMLACLPPGSLIVADAGFTGFDLLRDILAHGHSFLIRVGAKITLLTGLNMEGEQEGDTVWLWPTSRRGESPLKLRLIRLTKRAAGSPTPRCLRTNVLDPARLPEETAAVLYRMRWGVALFSRGLK
ncbi:MAG: transposase [Phycisphaerales bacterium]|nr:transposase [Phycisphaerales bacterium]